MVTGSNKKTNGNSYMLQIRIYIRASFITYFVWNVNSDITWNMDQKLVHLSYVASLLCNCNRLI